MNRLATFFSEPVCSAPVKRGLKASGSFNFRTPLARFDSGRRLSLNDGDCHVGVLFLERRLNLVAVHFTQGQAEAGEFASEQLEHLGVCRTYLD